jgi:nucleoside-diphosphate-sugar epimerase
MRILLTGASGFIGKNYLENTVNEKITTISRSNFDFKNVYRHIQGDLSEIDFLSKVARERYDVIIHAAWVGLPALTNDFNYKNFAMYKNIIDAFSNTQDAKHIFFGSCLEYGSLVGTINEKIKGRDVKDFGQKKISQLKYVQEKGIKFNWIRLFYCYGKYQHSNSLINSIQKNISDSSDHSIQNPNKVHDYIYIKDVVSLIDKILTSTENHGIVNSGSGKAVSVGTIANNVLQIMGKSPVIQVQNTTGLVADISKAKKNLNWEPKYSLVKGLTETLKGGNYD